MVECQGLIQTATKIKKMYDKAVDDYFHPLRFVPNCDKTKKGAINLLVLILLQ